jgi:hypothetical protein
MEPTIKHRARPSRDHDDVKMPPLMSASDATIDVGVPSIATAI